MLNVGQLTNDLGKLLNKKGPVWTAAKEAIMTNYFNVDNNFDIHGQIEDAAETFADKFVDSLKKEQLNIKLANIIDQYIKSASFSCVLPIPDPTSGSTLASPAGPVTGTINILPTTKINIL